jgi:hypothetical protein
VAETNGLLNRRTDNSVPRVRIPPSPPTKRAPDSGALFVGGDVTGFEPSGSESERSGDDRNEVEVNPSTQQRDKRLPDIIIQPPARDDQPACPKYSVSKPRRASRVPRSCELLRHRIIHNTVVAANMA